MISSRLKWPLFSLCVFLAIFTARRASAATPRPPERLQSYVTDLAGVMGEDVRQSLEARFAELEQKTGAQMAVLTIDSLDGEEISAFSLSVAEKWKLGQKGKDNGVLLTVAVRDRKYRIEVGYGLERVLPDSFVGTIGRQRLVPNFKRGDYGAGILSASDEIIDKIAADAGVTLSKQAVAVRSRANSRAEAGFTKMIFFIVFAIIMFLIGLFRRGRRRGTGIWIGGGGFGGSGGGFGGGFGGGGGGDFGGGGAGGDW